jgi:hypothetical protein
MVIRPATILGITLTGADEPVYPSTCVSNPAGCKQQTGRIKDKKGGENIRRTIANMSNIKVKDKR